MGTVNERRRASGIPRGSASWIASPPTVSKEDSCGDTTQSISAMAASRNGENHPLHISTHGSAVWIQGNADLWGRKELLLNRFFTPDSHHVCYALQLPLHASRASTHSPPDAPLPRAPSPDQHRSPRPDRNVVTSSAACHESILVCRSSVRRPASSATGNFSILLSLAMVVS